MWIIFAGRERTLLGGIVYSSAAISKEMKA
jgi:hypothetical protein